jgi:hypothetical protein
MLNATLIPTRLAKLFELCLKEVAFYMSPEDKHFEIATDYLPADFSEMLDEGLKEYRPIMVYSAPRKDQSEPLHLLVIGHKGKERYALTFGLGSGSYETCMALLREAADERRAPWHYWNPDSRGWTAVSAVIAFSCMVTVLLALFEFGANESTLWTLLAFICIGACLALLPLELGKILWDRRAKQIHELRDAIPA